MNTKLPDILSFEKKHFVFSIDLIHTWNPKFLQFFENSTAVFLFHFFAFYRIFFFFKELFFRDRKLSKVQTLQKY